jgi:cell division septation protein DedD
MPKFNLKGDAPKTTPQSTEAPAGKAPSGSIVKSLLIVLVAFVILASGIFFLNKSGVIHLWGKKAPVQTIVASATQPDTFAVPASVDTSALAESSKKMEPTVKEIKKKSEPAKSKTAAVKPIAEISKPKTEAPKSKTESVKPKTEPAKPIAKIAEPAAISSSGGAYSIQLSSWATVEKANIEVEHLKQKGIPAFVHETYVSGVGQRFRVNVGRFASAASANQEAQKIGALGEGSYLIIRMGK